MPNNSEFLTSAEVRRFLRLGTTKPQELLSNGDIPSYKIGRIRRVRKRDLIDWLERNRCDLKG